MFCISINHKNTTTQIREQFAFSKSEQAEFLMQLLQEKQMTGCVLLMTCNRSEFYFTGESASDEWLGRMEQKIAEYKKLPIDLLRSYSLRFGAESSIKHLYRVCCGLDSMVLGEVEIIRQVKEAYLDSQKMGGTDAALNIIFQGALNVAKEIASDSQMTKLPVSVGTLTAKEVISFCQANRRYHVLVVGATGKIGNIVIRDLADCKESVEMIGTSRSLHSGTCYFEDLDCVRMAEYQDRYRYLSWADVIVSATASPHYTFVAGKVAEALEGEGTERKERLFIDLAVPRDLDEELDRFSGCTLKNMDYIKKLSEENNRLRCSQAREAELLIQERVDEIEKTIEFQAFYKEQKELLEQLKKEDAAWLLYQLKGKLDAKAFHQVLEVLEK